MTRDSYSTGWWLLPSIALLALSVLWCSDVQTFAQAGAQAGAKSQTPPPPTQGQLAAMAAGNGKIQAVPPPAGSYKQHCKDIRVEQNQLWATCDVNVGRRDGLTVVLGYHVASAGLSFHDCAAGSDIVDVAGLLFCLAPQGSWGSGRIVPPGTYFGSCQSVYSLGVSLSASCRTNAGAMVNSVLNYAQAKCKQGSNITALNGQLACSSTQ